MEDKFTLGNIEYDLLVKTEIKQQFDLSVEEREAVQSVLIGDKIPADMEERLATIFLNLKPTYIIPDNHVNIEGNIIFTKTFISSNSKTIPIDSKKYITTVEVDPISDLIVNMKCDCEAWMYGEGEPCKHLNRLISGLHNLKIATGEFDL